MKINIINYGDELWIPTMEYAKKCSWKAGPYLANLMKNKALSEWERVLVAVESNNIIGYCIITKEDCIPNVPYTPFIGFMFVDENHRGYRLSEKMILSAMAYARVIGFNRIYLTSDHVNLYEKYGFKKIDEKLDKWGNLQKIYERVI